MNKKEDRSNRLNAVRFDEASHSYANDKGKRYISATTLVGKFKQPFDKVAVATAYARKHGNTPQYWIDQWAKITKIACEKGTQFHKIKEDHTKATAALITDNRVIEVRDLGEWYWNEKDYTKLPDGVYPELLMWNHYFELAGLADLVIIDGDYFEIEDYKTNKKIDRQSYFHPRTGYKKMKFPVHHLQDCNLMHYTLQLSIYAFMLEQLTRKKCRKLTIHHHGPDPLDPSKVLEEAVSYELEYLRQEVLMMLHMSTGKHIPQDLVI